MKTTALSARALDGDDLFDEHLEQQWKCMELRGYSREQIHQAKVRKREKENVRIYGDIVKQHAWETDISCNRTDVHLKYARALDAVGRRSDAIEMLQEATEDDHPFDSRIFMAVAKLLFRDDQKYFSLQYCGRIIERHKSMPFAESLEPESHISQDDIVKAYYLAGWINIHDDNHTKAYNIWSEGHRCIPECPVLKKQHKKRTCWDQNPAQLIEWTRQSAGLLTVQTCETTSSVNTNIDIRNKEDPGPLDYRKLLEHFEVASSASVPPLSLFCSDTQQRRLVFRSKEPLMSPEECSAVLKIVDEYHTNNLSGVWGTVRQSSVKTTDVAVEDILPLRAWLLALMHSKLFPLLALAFPRLADSSNLLNPDGTSRLRVHDAFIVRYDAVRDKSLSLPEHCDTSSMSVIFALNEEDKGNEEGQCKEGMYRGGGTWFEALGLKGSGKVINADIGQAVMFAGPLKHAGFPISRGVRNILVLFLYVENFHYGPYLRTYSGPDPGPDSTLEIAHSENGVRYSDGENCAEEIEDKRSSGAEKGGYVVYRQTVDLVSMLEDSLEDSAEDSVGDSQ